MEAEKPKFEIGQEVQCIDAEAKIKDKYFPLEMDKRDIIRDIKTCKCGAVVLDIGYHAPIGTICGDCGEVLDEKIPYFASRRFIITKSVEETQKMIQAFLKEQNERNQAELDKAKSNTNSNEIAPSEVIESTTNTPEETK